MASGHKMMMRFLLINGLKASASRETLNFLVFVTAAELKAALTLAGLHVRVLTSFF